MIDLMVSLLLFAGAVFIHIFICRRSLTRGLLIKQFAVIAFSNFFFLILFLIYLPLSRSLAVDSFWEMPLPVTSLLIYLLLIPVYLTFYTNTQLMSPSKKILLILKERGEMTFEELLKELQKENFISTRLRELVQSRCLSLQNGTYQLNSSGRSFARFLRTYQQILGREKGG